MTTAPEILHTPEATIQADGINVLPDLATIQERHPDWPKLNLSFYFAGHGNSKDMEGIAPHLAKADILLYEEVLIDESYVEKRYRHLNELNQMSVSPTMSLYKYLWHRNFKGTAEEPLVRGIYGSKKAMGVIDVGDNEHEREIGQRLVGLFDMAHLKGMAYYDALATYDTMQAEIGDLMLERESVMVDKFEHEIDRILYARPDLHRKKAVNILFSMGAAHTTLGHTFREAGMEPERHFSKKPVFTYRHDDELVRSYMFHKQPSELLVKRALADRVLSVALDRVSQNNVIRYDDLGLYTRNIISLMTEEELEKTYDAWNNGMDLREHFDDVLLQHGMNRLARNGKDIEKYVAKFEKRRGKLAKAALWRRNK